MMTATYSPEDNKLRLYSSTRLDSETYQRVRAAGFKWAPKQDLFVAPMWTPDREDLLIELCGEIGDEDTSLVERAEQRADRFEEYSDKRASDANAARKAVSAIADNIPLGQPILVGHHSERHARKDAERIENGMRKAVKMWESSKYWEDRAAGALRHAKYLERPDVRHRRIKGLEADKRKQERCAAQYERCAKFWRGEAKLRSTATGEVRPFEVNYENAVKFTGMDTTYMSFEFPLAKYPRKPPASQYEGRMSLYSALGSHDGADHAIITVEQARDLALGVCARVAEHTARWITHYNNRLTYERAMLQEQGGIITDKVGLVPGGMVKARGEWLTIIRVNRSEGKVTSVTTNSRYVRVKGVEEIEEYRPPNDGDVERLKAAISKPPLCNYPGKGLRMINHWHGDLEEGVDCVPITQAKWDDTNKDYKATRIVKETATVGRHRVRWMIIGGGRYAPVFITDAKRTDPPEPNGAKLTTYADLAKETEARGTYRPPEKSEEDKAFENLKDTLKEGVKVVSAPQLFPTPPELAKRVVELADIQAGHRILEPSAGTGNLIRAVNDASALGYSELQAIEINHQLFDQLRNRYEIPGTDQAKFLRADFLECNGDLGKFDRIVMNPPFADGQDIKHIEHALGFLKPGGRLVAICANGPLQQKALQPIADQWIDLGPGAFAESGTNVNAAIVVIQL